MVLNSTPPSRIIRAAYGPTTLPGPGSSGGPIPVKASRAATAQVPADGVFPGGRFVVPA